MSQIPIFYLLDTAKLDELREHARFEVIKKLFSKKYINHYDDYLKNNATLLYGLGGNDLNFPPFLAILLWVADEKGIDLLAGDYKEEAEVLSEKSGTPTVIWTASLRDAFRKIDFETIPDDVLKRIALEHQSEGSDEDLEAMREALRATRTILEKIGEGQVVIFLIS